MRPSDPPTIYEITTDREIPFLIKDIKSITVIRFRSTRLLDVLFIGNFDFLILSDSRGFGKGAARPDPDFSEFMKTQISYKHNFLLNGEIDNNLNDGIL